MTTNGLAMTERCMDAIARTDVAGWCELMAENCVFSCPFAPAGIPARVEGRANMQAFITQLFDNVRTFTWHDVTYYQTNDPQVVFVTARSQVETANGKPYANQYVILSRVSNGKVTEWREYNNPAPIVTAFSDFF